MDEAYKMMQHSMINSAMGSGHWLWMLMIALIVIIPTWRICQRIGYSGWMGLLILFPLINLVLFYFIAFSDWPVNKKGERNE